MHAMWFFYWVSPFLERYILCFFFMFFAAHCTALSACCTCYCMCMKCIESLLSTTCWQTFSFSEDSCDLVALQTNRHTHTLVMFDAPPPTHTHAHTRTCMHTYTLRIDKYALLFFNRFRPTTMLVSMTTRGRHGHFCFPAMKKQQSSLSR